jgi:hypothetical protein
VLKFLLVVLLIAVLVYVLTNRVMGASERRRAGHPYQGPRLGRPRSGPRPRPVAPDDDEDFLRWLDRKRRKDLPDQ